MQRRTAAILVLVLLITLGFAAKIAFPPPTILDEAGLNETNETPETPPSEEESQEEVGEQVVERDECPDIPSGIHRSDMLAGSFTTVNQSLTLDASSLFGVDTSEDIIWTQLMPEQNGRFYHSSHVLSFSNTTGTRVNVTAHHPGQYAVSLGEGSEDLRWSITAKQDDSPELAVKGINFIDLFGETGAPEFNINPENPTCREEAFMHAIEGPERVNANMVGLVSAVFINQIEPLEFGDGGNFLSLTDEDFYAEMVEELKSRGFNVSETLSDSPGLELSPEENEALRQRQETPEYLDEFFTLWEVHVVDRAERAERHGVDLFIPYLFADYTMNPDIYPEYHERWVQIFSSIREVYSGEIGFSVINADERLTFLDEIDVLQITIFGGLYTSREGLINDVQKPTLEELIQITEDITWHHEELSQTVPIHYVITFASSDGQNTSEDPELRGEMDLSEQALYYEAFFNAMNQPWVSGIISERWDYWDDWRRTADTPEAAYFDESTGSTPRNKPAEDVVALWFSMR